MDNFEDFLLHINEYNTFSFIVDQKALPTPRPRVTESGVFYPKNYQNYFKTLLLNLKLKKIPKKEYSQLHLIFGFKYNSSTKKSDRINNKPCNKLADNDNLAKGVMDALEKLQIIDNDKQLWFTSQRKLYSLNNSYIKGLLVI